MKILSKFMDKLHGVLIYTVPTYCAIQLIGVMSRVFDIDKVFIFLGIILIAAGLTCFDIEPKENKEKIKEKVAKFNGKTN